MNTIGAVRSSANMRQGIQINVVAQGNGKVSISPAGPYTDTEAVTVTATPNAGAQFLYWLDQNGWQYPENPWQVNFAGEGLSSVTLTAVFAGGTAPTYSTNVTISPAGAGNVAISPSGPQPANTNITLTPTPVDGYVFDHWTFNGVNEYASELDITIYGTTNITAYFVPVQVSQSTYNINESASPSAGGEVSTDTAGPYTENQVVELIASPANSYQFDHWLVNGQTYTTPEVYITMPGANVTAVAYFVKQAVTTYSLQVSVSPAGGGHFTQSAFGPFAPGATVTLQAIAATGYIFDHWDFNGQSSTNPTVNVQMEGNGSAIAYFTATESGGGGSTSGGGLLAAAAVLLIVIGASGSKKK